MEQRKVGWPIPGIYIPGVIWAHGCVLVVIAYVVCLLVDVQAILGILDGPIAMYGGIHIN